MGYYDRDFHAGDFCKKHGIELDHYNVGFSTRFVAKKGGMILGTKNHFGGWWDLSLGPWLRGLVEKEKREKETTP